MDTLLDATIILYHPMPQDPGAVKEALNITQCESHYYTAFHRADWIEACSRKCSDSAFGFDKTVVGITYSLESSEVGRGRRQ